jgi:hypothetical protein
MYALAFAMKRIRESAAQMNMGYQFIELDCIRS